MVTFGKKNGINVEINIIPKTIKNKYNYFCYSFRFFYKKKPLFNPATIKDCFYGDEFNWHELAPYYKDGCLIPELETVLATNNPRGVFFIKIKRQKDLQIEIEPDDTYRWFAQELKSGEIKKEKDCISKLFLVTFIIFMFKGGTLHTTMLPAVRIYATRSKLKKLIKELKADYAKIKSK